MTNLIEQLNQAGEIKMNGCILTIRGDRYRMSKGDNVHSIDVESSCERRLSTHWLGFVDNVGEPEAAPLVAVAPVKAKAKPRKAARTYVVTFAVVGEGFTGVNDVSSENVLATDRDDALRQGREIWRHAQGPYGLKCKMTARLAEFQ